MNGLMGDEKKTKKKGHCTLERVTSMLVSLLPTGRKSRCGSRLNKFWGWPMLLLQALVTGARRLSRGTETADVVLEPQPDRYTVAVIFKLTTNRRRTQSK